MLNQLYTAIREGAKSAYNEGEQAGHNLIMGLATGRKSIDEFNAATVGEVANKPRKKQR